ncbi:DUF6197 family protein [Streptomyces sp. MZ04]|uniref:DUF6197 family protein n=1 Tax=Streptomyces sp. MZ04 TaxID=2559236 RepID=UPI00107EB789|nr:DUF6197 family protein [Streptomyces sp. MZ04]TGB11590.1 hypothetical protein E2651_12995 [Streptomyces sp. MZ04]
MTTTTKPATTQLADILELAADHIERVGLHRGYQYDFEQYEQGTALRDCPVCTLGAINFAVCGSPMLDGSGHDTLAHAVALVDSAAAALARHIGITPTPRSVLRWSDDPERTQDDVVQAFRETATNLRAEAAA